MKVIHGVCPHDCPDSCGLVSEVSNGRIQAFYAAEQHPVTQGWLCGKVRPYLDHVYHPDRLLHPLRRVGPKGSGQWQQISWEAALAEIGERWRDIIATYGAAAILPHSYSGTLGMVQLGATNTRFWNRLGASRLERAICGAAAEMAVNLTLGKRRSPAYESVQHSRVVIVWGHNPVTTAPHFMPHLAAAHRAGTQLVVIDPRRTRTAKQADWHIAPQPGSDGVLALAVARVIVAAGLHDEAWLAAHSVGWPQLRQRLDAYTLEMATAVTGIAAADIVRLAHLYAENTPSLIKFADGLQRNHNGGQTCRAICALPAITGQYGKLGGGLMYSTSGYAEWDEQALGKWEACPPPGRKVNMNRLGAALTGEVGDPPIQSLYVFASNPAAISPNAGLIRQGMLREDLFTVVHELFMTDTADLADIVLPATSQLEHVDLHRAYGHTTLGYNAPAIAPLGACKSNWDVMRLLAAEMGFTEPWLQQTADEVIDEVVTATAVHNPALRGITLARLQQESYVPLALDQDVPFADGVFPTPSGKVELYCQTMADMGLDPLPGWSDKVDDGGVAGLNGRFDPAESLNLITAAAHHFVSSSFANREGLLKHEGDAFVEIHPDDAACRGVQTGDWVIVENGRGWCELKAKVTDAVRPGVLASPKGRWQKLSNGRNVNWTTSDALGDMAGQSTFHSNRVWLRLASKPHATDLSQAQTSSSDSGLAERES